MTTVVAPFKVVSTLYGRAGLQCSAAEDANGQELWLFTHSDASPAASERMHKAARLCMADGPWLKVLDCGVDAGRAWVVTRPQAGKSLAELIHARGALDAPEMLPALLPVCQALQQLADRGHAAAVTAELVHTNRDGDGVLIGFSPETSSATVPALGRLMFETLKGSPPIDPPEDLIGVRQQLSDFVKACIEGRLTQAGTVGDQLRIVGRGETVDLQKLIAHDTRVSAAASSSSVKPAEAGERAGELLGSYQLVRRLGEGGMGEVYLGRHVKLGREVAVKVLRPELARDPEILRRFFQEARVVNEINHPHIVEVIDFVEELNHAYCVMELLKGDPLDRFVEVNGVLPVARTTAIMAQVCEALHAAHQRGIVHRDVKPANIFLGKDDFVKVLDFGVARVAKAEGSRTQVGAVLGTPAYMSPEQAQGRVVDGRADVYSVGAVLYELLSGRVLSQELFTPPPLIDTARGEPVPGPLAEIVQQCLEMDPARRPASAKEVADRLSKALPTKAPHDTARAMADAGLRAKGPGRSPLFAALALVAVLGTGTVWMVLRPTGGGDVMGPPPPMPMKVSEPPAGMLPADPEPAQPGTPVKPVLKPRPKPSGRKTPEPVAAAAEPPDPYIARMNHLQKEYDGLVGRYGVGQLTAIEREVVRQALEDYAGRNYGQLDKTLKDAERALQAAHARLDR